MRQRLWKLVKIALVALLSTDRTIEPVVLTRHRDSIMIPGTSADIQALSVAFSCTTGFRQAFAQEANLRHRCCCSNRGGVGLFVGLGELGTCSCLYYAVLTTELSIQQ